MATKEDYDAKSIDWLLECMSTGIDWTELKTWLAKHEKPELVARLHNSAVVKGGGSRIDEAAQEYVAALHEMATNGDSAKGLRLVLTGAQNLHNAIYYLRSFLANGNLLTELAAVDPGRWSKTEGFLGRGGSK